MGVRPRAMGGEWKRVRVVKRGVKKAAEHGVGKSGSIRRG